MTLRSWKQDLHRFHPQQWCLYNQELLRIIRNRIGKENMSIYCTWTFLRALCPPVLWAAITPRIVLSSGSRFDDVRVSTQFATYDSNCDDSSRLRSGVALISRHQHLRRAPLPRISLPRYTRVVAMIVARHRRRHRCHRVIADCFHGTTRKTKAVQHWEIVTSSSSDILRTIESR